jgi:hypothetical protein
MSEAKPARQLDRLYTVDDGELLAFASIGQVFLAFVAPDRRASCAGLFRHETLELRLSAILNEAASRLRCTPRQLRLKAAGPEARIASGLPCRRAG